ncbi:hypothetical protein SEA_LEEROYJENKINS_77 [Microbacterium phage LeeroyJenkins]|nr:hypothetical protein SEA_LEEROYJENKINS_77 [Microbacterium phage LeeroyJenkins]
MSLPKIDETRRPEVELATTRELWEEIWVRTSAFIQNLINSKKENK